MNGLVKKAKYTVEEGDVISYELPEVEEVEYVAEDIPLEIVYQDEDVAAVSINRRVWWSILLQVILVALSRSGVSHQRPVWHQWSSPAGD